MNWTRVYACLDVLRPGQWVKNLLVYAGLFFALADTFQEIDVQRALIRTTVAFALFCAVSGAVYIMNDVHDVAFDQAHPEKQRRPIASGRLPVTWAVGEATLLIASSFAVSPWLGWRFTLCMGVYFLMQVLYTCWLKQIVLVDVLTISLGFVLRAYVGTVAAEVPATLWLFVCTFLGAHFLGLCKRYDEKTSLGKNASKHRKVLEKYNAKTLKMLITADGFLAVLCYAVYTLIPVTVEKFGTIRIVYTVPFVAFGFVRYLFLVFYRGAGGRPEKTLIRDIPTAINILLYVIACVAIKLTM